MTFRRLHFISVFGVECLRWMERTRKKVQSEQVRNGNSIHYRQFQRALSRERNIRWKKKMFVSSISNFKFSDRTSSIIVREEEIISFRVRMPEQHVVSNFLIEIILCFVQLWVSRLCCLEILTTCVYTANRLLSTKSCSDPNILLFSQSKAKFSSHRVVSSESRRNRKIRRRAKLIHWKWKIISAHTAEIVTMWEREKKTQLKFFFFRAIKTRFFSLRERNLMFFFSFSRPTKSPQLKNSGSHPKYIVMWSVVIVSFRRYCTSG